MGIGLFWSWHVACEGVVAAQSGADLRVCIVNNNRSVIKKHEDKSMVSGGGSRRRNEFRNRRLVGAADGSGRGNF